MNQFHFITVDINSQIPLALAHDEIEPYSSNDQ